MSQAISRLTHKLGIEKQDLFLCLELYVASGLAIMLLPFGVNSHTKFLADKVLPSIVSSGLKLMFLAFIMSVAMPIFYERKISLQLYAAANIDIPLTSAQSAESLGVSMALAFLCWNAPSMAAGLMSGMGSGLSAASIGQTHFGMSNMSATIGASGGGNGFGARMQGVSAAMAAATGNKLSANPNNDGSNSQGVNGSPPSKQVGDV